MEAMLGETGEGSREEASSSSCDTGGTCFNGELNGDLEENMERCNVNQHNSIMLKVVSNRYLNEERSSITDSSPQVTSNSGSIEHRQEIFSEKSETSDKVPNSEPANMCRDLASEVPTSVEKSVEHIDIGKSMDIQDNIPVSTHSIKDSELSKEILDVNKNCDELNSHSSVHENNAVLNDVMRATEKSVVDFSDNCEMKSGSDEKYVANASEKSVVFENNADYSIEKNCVVSDEEISIKKLDSAENEIGSFGGEEEEHITLQKTNGKEDSGEESAKDDDLNMPKPVADDDSDETENKEKTQSKDTLADAVRLDGSEQNNDNTKSNDQYQVLSSVREEKNEHTQNPSDNKEAKSEEVSAKAKKSRKSATVLNLTPRRSSRNLNKQKSYVEKEDEPEIQEITPGDPLADPLSTDPLRDDKENSKTRGTRKNTIVVNDTKRLVEIATGSKGMKGGKKEPTLVIIDTNSILSGRGPVPVSQGSPPGPSSVSTSTSGYSVLPIALPAQGFYPPIRLNSPLPPNPVHPPAPAPVQPRPSPPQILPTLTDDMYVVEAPSFIVPYVYEKPPIKPLKEYLEQLEIEIEETKSNKETGNEDEKVAPNCTQENDSSENEQVKNQEDEEQSKVNGEESEMQTPSTRLEDENQSSDKDVDASGNISDSDNISKSKAITTETKEESSEKEMSITDSEKGAETTNSENNGNNTSEGREKNEIKLDETSKSTYFDNPLGKFFMQIGINLVQEYVQTDLLRSQKRKRDREGRKGTVSTQFAINSLVKNLEFSKENNEPFHLEQKKCEYCSFKTESSLVMAQHLETPHMRNYVYRCNFCPLEVRSPHDILFHMEAEHNVRGRLERAPAFHQCPNCPFEDSQKGKLTRHMLSCAKKHKPERNQEPPPDWEPPAKIPRLARSRPTALGLGAAAYQAMAAKSVHPLLPKLVPGTVLPPSTGSLNRGRGRPPIHGRYIPDPKTTQRPIAPTQIRQNMMYRPGASTGQQQVLLPTAYQIAGSQIYQSQSKSPTAKLLQQPSISITPLPRQPAGMAPGSTMHPKNVGHSGHPGHSPNKATFVICEICDGYIKDLEQLRNHMQWIHKVKIHPKMIYNRPPLNCQKCQFRFFTDQGLERHLLGSHGLVTSSMQEAANKGKDGGRCPVCGRVYQWKLLNHVARDHNMSLKPAHLSYKCTVCTATFGMYKQFENHVYSAHSVVAKRVIDKKSPQVPRPQSSETLLKPLKINDEITIIPQPARPRPGPASRTGAVSAIMQQNMGKVYSCEKCEATFDGQTGFTQYLSHMRQRHLRRCDIKVCRLEDCPTCKRRHITQSILDYLEEHKSGVDVIELSDDEVVFAGQGRNEITITKVSCAPGPKRFKQRLQQKQSSVQVIELEDSPVKKDKATDGSGFQENGEDTLNAVKERLRRRKSLEISQVDSECSSHLSDDTPAKKRRRNDE